MANIRGSSLKLSFFIFFIFLALPIVHADGWGKTEITIIIPGNGTGGGNGGGPGGSNLIYTFVCDKQVVYGGNLKCTVSIENPDFNKDYNVTAKYKILFGPENHDLEKSYFVERNQTKIYVEKFHIVEETTSIQDYILKALLGKELPKEGRIKVEFIPQYAVTITEFRIINPMNKYIPYVIAALIAIIIITVLTGRTIKRRRNAKNR